LVGPHRITCRVVLVGMSRYPTSNPKKLFWLLMTVGLALLSTADPSFADEQTVVSADNHPRVPGILISCYHAKTRRLTAEIKPSRCDIAGQEGEQRKAVSFPIKNLRWAEWGEFRSQGSLGVNVRTDVRVRVIAFRRVRCADGRTFYSAANVVEPGNGSYSVVRLPVCDDSG
jgi:hypothetical protein